MPFRHIGFPDKSNFKHVLSDKTFILERISNSQRLLATLYHRDVKGSKSSKSEAGHIKVASRFDSHLALNPVGNESHFTVTYIRTQSGYRNISLGAMLMFIVAREAQINSGVYLYLQNPVLEALGFYTQFGFHPAPENVAKHHFRVLQEYRETRKAIGCDDLDEVDISLQCKIKMSRNFSLWRGSVNTVLDLLTKKTGRRFYFLNI